MFLKVFVPLLIIFFVFIVLKIRKKRRKNQRTGMVIAALAALPIGFIPDISAGFVRFLKEVHGIDIEEMPYERQIDYILTNFTSLWRPELNSYISAPGSGEIGSGVVIMAAGAFLGELVRSRQTAQWKKNPDDPILPPYLEVECCGEAVMPCNPFEMMLFGAAEGKRGAVLGDLLVFESREILDNSIKTWQSENVYSPGEIEVFETHVKKHFGEIRLVMHEKNSPDMHVDVYIIEPTADYPAVRLLTCGMGGRRMELMPENVRKVCPDRLELMIDLPPDWPLDMESLSDERNYWPMRVLKILARFPWDNETWLGFSHTIPWPEPFAENTRLCGVLLGIPAVTEQKKIEIEVSPGKKVQIFQLIPIYQEEMDYKVKHDAEKLMALWGDNFSYVIDPARKNAVTGE